MASNEYAHLYNAQWRRSRAAWLRSSPLCVMCDAAGRLQAAHVVDHIKPHRGDLGLFWDRSNWQSLCRTHHDASKQRAEARGVDAIGCDATGIPIDASHHWNK